MYRLTALWLFLCPALILFAQQPVGQVERGEVTQAELVAEFGPLMQNGARMYKLSYTTTDVFGQPDTASGLVVIPLREAPTVFPLLCFLHGTIGAREDVPSNRRGGYEAGLVFAGLGYVTVLPDLLGLGDSRGFHPYVHAASEASASVDMLRAVRLFAAGNGVLLNDQVFVAGYSQGGHAAMALHRSLELEHAGEFTVTASAPMSGPYSISTVMKAAMASEEEYFFPGYVPYTLLSYDYVYGLFDTEEDYFKQPYAGLIGQFYREEIDLSTLNDTLISLLESTTGASVPRRMLQDSLIDAVLIDQTHPLNVALTHNDVFDWAPQAPTRLFYCQADDQVDYRNSVLADSVMNLRGAADLAAINVNPGADHNACVEPAFISTALFFGLYQDLQVASREPGPVLSGVEVFPNPAQGQLMVSGMTTEGTATLYLLSGVRKGQFHLGAGSNTILLSGWPAGLYLLEIRTREGILLKRVVLK